MKNLWTTTAFLSCLFVAQPATAGDTVSPARDAEPQTLGQSAKEGQGFTFRSGCDFESNEPIVGVVFRKARHPGVVGSAGGGGSVSTFGATMAEIASWAYDFPLTRVVEGDGIPAGTFDLIASVSGGDGMLRAIVRSILENRYGIICTTTTQRAETFVLKRGGLTRRLIPGTPGQPGPAIWRAYDSISTVNLPVESFAALLEMHLGVPVLDRTGLQGHYNIDVPCSSLTVDNAPQTVREATGLRLVHTEKGVELLLVVGVVEVNDESKVYFADAN